METYKKLTPPEKKACRKYIIHTFKKHHIRKINGKTVASNRVPDLINEFQIKFKRCPIVAFKERLKDQVSSKKGYVYVIGNLNAKICKIGFSEKPKERIKSIQTGCPHLLKIILLFEAEKYTETKLHHKYARYKLYGEWFLIDGTLKESIYKHIKTQPLHV